MRDRNVLFHEKWLGLAQPIDGLVFSVPVLADAQIAPELRPELSAAFGAHVDQDGGPRIRSIERFLRDFLGYEKPGMLVPRAELPADLSFYAAEGGQELRPSFALGRGPFDSDDPFAIFDEEAPSRGGVDPDKKPWIALLWDLTESGQVIDLDVPEAATGRWRYPPTAKLERLLRHVGVPVGLLFNGPELRLVYAPAGESSAHLTFRVEHMVRPDGRPLLAALDLLLHARRAYTASPEHTLEGLLVESRRRQADVTDALAKQVFEAIEILVAGFEAAAARDIGDSESDRIDWLRAALEEEGDHFYQGVLSVVLRLVFLLYAEDQSLLPVEHPTFAAHLSLFGLYERLSHDAGAHPESMHHRFGAYGQLLSLFRTVFFGVKHGSLELPARRGRLFDPNAFPFLEGGLAGWTAAVVDPEARAAARPPSVDDEAIYRVLHRLVVFEGQRLSYRALDVEQIGSVYESLMGYHVLRLTSGAVRVGKFGVWVETDAVRAMSATDRARFFKETCGLNPGPAQSLEKSLQQAKDEPGVIEALSAQAVGRKSEVLRHRAAMGRLVLQPGHERRRTASHYTPRSLTERVVKRTLEPLLACLGPERTPDQILQLKICDPAMGSGAFLVATCRELASEIVAAWTRRGELAKLIEEHGDAHLHARRLVAQTCLYGVDKNAAAVELAKLSLWLVTLSKRLPFTFVDHALRHGDSLVGLDFKQIEAFHWAPAKQTETFRVLLREALDQAVDLRQQILALADKEDAASQGEKRRLFEFAQQAIDRVRVVADVCIGAFFAETKDAMREKERKRRLALVEQWLGGNVEAGAEVEALALDARKVLTPFHWWIEFPEVFFDERPDPLQGGAVNGAALMEGVVGNPPFGGKNNISDANAAGYLEWLMAVRPDVKGRPNTDLSAYFFRRAADMIGAHGTLGLIATNTIAQGDSRLMSLKALVDAGARIYAAQPDMEWPGKAGVVVSVVHLALGRVRDLITSMTIDDRTVSAIDSRLTPHPERPEPVRLSANANLAFMGGKLVGAGLAVTLTEREALVAADPINSEVLRPYLGGEDVNSNPKATFERYVIDFTTKSLDEARRYPLLMRIIEEKVRPARESDKRGTYKTYWWRPGESGGALYEALTGKARCLVAANVTKHLMFSFQPTEWFFSQTLYVFAFDAYTQFALLQSRAHSAWTILLSSSMGRDNQLRYAASDCFETFPFPRNDPRELISAVEVAGERFYSARARYMADTQQGMTAVHNALNDRACPDARILELRRIHEDMDRAVLDAYGWTDIATPPYCPKTDAEKQELQAFENEVIDRLYVLNAQRADEEQRLGLARKGRRAGANGVREDVQEPAEQARATKPASAKTKATKRADPKDQGKLFE